MLNISTCAFLNTRIQHSKTGSMKLSNTHMSHSKQTVEKLNHYHGRLIRHHAGTLPLANEANPSHCRKCSFYVSVTFVVGTIMTLVILDVTGTFSF